MASLAALLPAAAAPATVGGFELATGMGGAGAAGAGGFGNMLASILGPAAISSVLGGGSGRPAYDGSAPPLPDTQLPALPSNLMPLLESYGKLGAMNTQQRYANDFYTILQRLQGRR